MFINQKISNLIFFLFCFSIYSSISQANEDVPLNNIAINENPKLVSAVIFEDFSGKEIRVGDYYGKLVIINFWATWCSACKEEMPSLDRLSQNKNFKNLKIFAVNVEKANILKTKRFFTNLNIQNLPILFDEKLNFVKSFKLRGIPTTILINKQGEEFARIVGSIDFEDKKFTKWLLNYD